MILGIGIDIEDTGRVEREIARGDWGPGDGVFTPEEIRQCNASRHPGRSFAVRFAAKEAILKALGIAVSDLEIFREIAIEYRRGGRPRVALRRRVLAESERQGVRGIHLTVTGNAGHSGAMVILET